MTPAERLKKITETVQEFLAEGKALSSNDLLRVLSKRMPGWKPTKEEVALLEEEIMNQREQVEQVRVESDLDTVEAIEAAETVEAIRPLTPGPGPVSRRHPEPQGFQGHQGLQGAAAAILRLKELLQYHTKEDLFALLMEVNPPK